MGIADGISLQFNKGIHISQIEGDDRSSWIRYAVGATDPFYPLRFWIGAIDNICGFIRKKSATRQFHHKQVGVIAFLRLVDSTQESYTESIP